MFFTRPPEIADVDLEGKTAIITGANSGIGFVTAVDVAKRGARLVLGCRNIELGEKAVADIKEQSGNENVYLMQLDLSSLESVRNFAKEFLEKESALHILINNAGIMMLPHRELSKDGYEMQFAVNHLGHFLLTKLLLDCLKKSAPSRVVNVSSLAHRFAWSFELDDINLDNGYGFLGISAYSRSKLANILFTKELHRRFYDEGIASFSLHPGVIATKLPRYTFAYNWLSEWISTWFMLTPKQGAQTSIFCAVQPELEELSGEYFNNRIKTEPSSMAKDPDLAKRLWEVSEQLIETKKDDTP